MNRPVALVPPRPCIGSLSPLEPGNASHAFLVRCHRRCKDIMKLTITRRLSFASRPVGTRYSHFTPSEPASPIQKRTRAEFMRQKLEFSKQVLEGLALEQFATIEKGGKALKKLSEAAEWEVAIIPNATDYVMLTTDFQRHADELVKQAKAKNIDGATLAYVKLTMSCVQCHKFIRDTGK